MTADRLFVGRRRELALMRRELVAGRHLVLGGPFGIGRTALAREAARRMGDGWRLIFLDASRPPSTLCRDLLTALAPAGPSPRTRSALSGHACRAHVAAARLPRACRHVIVLDDLVHLSSPKAEWLRWALSLERFRFVVVVESSLPSGELARLRGLLVGAKLVSLAGLTIAATERLLTACSRSFDLGWDAESLRAMAVSTHGYPLGAWMLVQGARDKLPHH